MRRVLLIVLVLSSPVVAQRAGGPPPRIVSFEAKPASVKPGQPVLLVWATENPAGVTIEPATGAVTPRGSRPVTPSATTTYTLTMKGGPTRSVVVTVEGSAPAAAGGATTIRRASRSRRRASTASRT